MHLLDILASLAGSMRADHRHGAGRCKECHDGVCYHGFYCIACLEEELGKRSKPSLDAWLKAKGDSQ